MLQPPDDGPLPDPYASNERPAADPHLGPSGTPELHADGVVVSSPRPRSDSLDELTRHRPVPSSPYATWSVVAGTGALILFLTGPVLGLVAIVLGVLGWRQVSRAAGEVRGRLVAALGIVFGTLSIAFFLGVVALYLFVVRPVRSAMEGSADQAADDDTTDVSGRSPTVSAPGPALTTSTVTTIGTVTVVDIAIGVASLASELKRQHAEATEHGERLLLETTSSSCEPCAGVATSLSDPRMQAALDHVRIVRVDRDPFEEDLAELQIPSRPFPGFFLLDSDLKVKDGINGGEWEDDIAGNIAPVLGPFVRGAYAKRRTPWKKLPHGTVL
jgi:hypothetical protein